VKAEVVDYVLRKPPKEQREAIDKGIEQSRTALPLLLAGDMERALMKVHAKPPRPKPPRPEVVPADKPTPDPEPEPELR
jgi:PTH1 family peptidyl-tRNA hydrolase